MTISEDSRKIGAEIEVTEEMVEAGLWELDARLPDLVFVAGDAEALVRKIFLAMLNKSPAITRSS